MGSDLEFLRAEADAGDAAVLIAAMVDEMR